MMNNIDDLPSLLQRKTLVQNHLSQLTPGQFQIVNCLRAQLQSLNSQITLHQHPSMVNLQYYSPPDSAFAPNKTHSKAPRHFIHNTKPNFLHQRKSYATKHHVKVIDDEDEEENDFLTKTAIDKTISRLEFSIKEKEILKF
jgi:hypothetical protein